MVTGGSCGELWKQKAAEGQRQQQGALYSQRQAKRVQTKRSGPKRRRSPSAYHSLVNFPLDHMRDSILEIMRAVESTAFTVLFPTGFEMQVVEMTAGPLKCHMKIPVWYTHRLWEINGLPTALGLERDACLTPHQHFLIPSEASDDGALNRTM
ncbi:hypothetical protein SKAU_G00180270 [Synaphobranchus kaupii]|uniref:Uncharacterized protein n=1 Tax=Synaphobranchus kaupii TaxID=118154 RepID=A0A9Q1J1Q1_SYNKA|nr:hypothetical protein SKAU_G00180270 [Synaphobranchus kaupii]